MTLRTRFTLLRRQILGDPRRYEPAIPKQIVRQWSWMPAANSPHTSAGRTTVLLANRARAVLAAAVLKGAGL